MRIHTHTFYTVVKFFFSNVSKAEQSKDEERKIGGKNSKQKRKPFKYWPVDVRCCLHGVCVFVYGISNLYIGFYHFCFAHVCLTSSDSFDRRFCVCTVHEHVCVCDMFLFFFFFKLDAISNWIFPSLLTLFRFHLLLSVLSYVPLSVCQRVTYFLALLCIQTYRNDFDTTNHTVFVYVDVFFQ